ncbi:hypothetical protein OZN62_08705 [Aurantiacibacter sp. MUD11]|uniref:hypothetical protein n=1 Tax=Aurantiacibacter sp. MUD11 TaxID=3003265 RepID=UPI0022AB00EF|nr:hypothetical protein [Aurantiacibacter sp. MUD11]WAT17021.1 hypothetical protein OZN62_08705 [Aurantiacibacter sp. MUD11]
MLKKILAATAVASLAFTPVAAHAGERASEANVSLAPLAAERAAAPISEEGEEAGVKISPALAAAIALLTGLVIHEIVTSKGIIH